VGVARVVKKTITGGAAGNRAGLPVILSGGQRPAPFQHSADL